MLAIHHRECVAKLFLAVDYKDLIHYILCAPTEVLPNDQATRKSSYRRIESS
jgi:hypothetical protein